jgi:3-methyladenine DNA glycosylase AlkD
MDEIIRDIRKKLQKNCDPATKASGLKFFREKIKLYGVKTAVVTQIANESYRVIKDEGKTKIFGLCEILWKSGYLEESFIACNLSYKLRRLYEKNDFRLFECWVNNYITNWASCDTFCNHTVGEFIEIFPTYIKELKKWAKSENRWVRRASAVSLIVPARKGKFLGDILEISDILLMDPDDMVQKGYGWMLKVASQIHLNEVFEYVMNNKENMPRTALRYAIEKMPVDLRKKAMA